MTDNEEKTFVCAKCGRTKARRDFHEANGKKRAVTSWCRHCRSDAYLATKHETVCPQCMKHKRLDKNKICRHCNAESGLKQCAKCRHLLPLHLEFYSRQSRCKRCLSKASKRRERELAQRAPLPQLEASASG